MTTNINVASTSQQQRMEHLDEIMANVHEQLHQNTRTGVLLAGDPGVGKTSFVRFFSLLVGMELITIEAPHITEEHIINIPFIVFNPVDKSEKKHDEKMNLDNEIVLADSSLFTEIKSKKKISDQEYLRAIYSAPADVQKTFELLGGSKDKIPDDIAEMRSKFEVILFLDEYFRQTSMRIRNMLRGILNGKIGDHDIPDNAYVMYASNMKDEGVEDIPLNNDFHRIEFGNPDKNDWFLWLINKYKDDVKKPIKQEVIDKFHKLLTTETLNNDDIDADVRTSPRRWEQLITYIDAALPAKDEKEAKGLMTNVKINFKNYLTGAHAELYKPVLNAVSELIEETSNIKSSPTNVHKADDWRSTLEHQIEQKMKMGKTRSYIPVISGMPGIGKTTNAMKVANTVSQPGQPEHLGLRYIYIDCSTLDPEDVTGIPLSKKPEGQKHQVHFSTPKLFKKITDDCKKADEHFLTDDPKGKEMGAAKYKNVEWKYLIFFDELNRTSTKVFNGLRRVLLEKSFGDGHILPPGSIIIAAINPHDHGAEELTKHMQDVVDIVDAKASFESTQKYLKDMPLKGIEDNVKKAIYGCVMNFADKFKNESSEFSEGEREFHLDIGAGGDLYISPREYSSLYATAAAKFQRILTRLMHKTALADMNDDDIKQFEKELKRGVFLSFKSILENIFSKHRTEHPEFLHTLEAWINGDDAIDFGEGIFYTKTKTESLASIVGPYFIHDENAHLKDEPEFMNYMKNVDPVEFKSDLTKLIHSYVKDIDDLHEHVTTPKHKARKLDQETQKEYFSDDKLVTTTENFFRNLIHAIHLLKLSNETLTPLLATIRTCIGYLHEELGISDESPEYEYITTTLSHSLMSYIILEFPHFKKKKA